MGLLGGGLVGCELGIHLAMNGRQVTILEMADHPNFAGNALHGEAVMYQIKDLGIELVTKTKAVEVTEEGVIGEGPEGRKLYEADTVIYAVGQRALSEEAVNLHDCAPEFWQIGDCCIPANILQAVKGGYYAARDIGRI